MFQEKRPTCVSVIGWTWIILGTLMVFSSILALLSWNMIGENAKADPEFQQNMHRIMKYFSYIAVTQLLVVIIGLVSGINFLKLKSWSRIILEILTWLFILFIVGFGIYWEFGWLKMTSGIGPKGFDIMGAVMGVVIIAIYGVPLGIMLKYLRGDIVKNAMIGPAEYL
jgi:hypothetical protein